MWWMDSCHFDSKPSKQIKLLADAVSILHAKLVIHLETWQLVSYFQSAFHRIANFLQLEPSTICQGLFGSTALGISPSSGTGRDRSRSLLCCWAARDSGEPLQKLLTITWKPIFCVFVVSEEHACTPLQWLHPHRGWGLTADTRHLLLIWCFISTQGAIPSPSRGAWGYMEDGRS